MPGHGYRGIDFDFSLRLKTSQVRVTHTHKHATGPSVHSSEPSALICASREQDTCMTAYAANHNPRGEKRMLPQQIYFQNVRTPFCSGNLRRKEWTPSDGGDARGGPSVKHRLAQLLCCTPETNEMHVSDASTKKKGVAPRLTQPGSLVPTKKQGKGNEH